MPQGPAWSPPLRPLSRVVNGRARARAWDHAVSTHTHTHLGNGRARACACALLAGPGGASGVGGMVSECDLAFAQRGVGSTSPADGGYDSRSQNGAQRSRASERNSVRAEKERWRLPS